MRSPRPHWQAVFAIVALTGVAYAGSLDGVFLLDDHAWIVRNDDLHTLWPPHVAMGGTLRPLLFYSLALNHAVSGLETWSYHLVNVALHVATALVQLGLVRRVLELPRLGIDPARARSLAFVVALLWAVHPLCSQSVVYVIQRGELMAALAYLLTLYGLVRSATAETAGGRRRYAAVSVTAFLLGLGCKETIVTAPFAALVLDAVLIAGTWRGAWRERRLLHAALFAPLLVGPALLALFAPGRFQLLFQTQPTVGVTAYLISQSVVVLEYVRLVLWPSGQNFDPAWSPPATSVQLVVAGFGLLAVIGCAVGVARRCAVSVLGALFLLFLAPSSSLMPLADAMAEHRMYLAGGVVVLAVVLLVDEWTRRSWSARARPVLVGVVALALTVATVGRVAVYDSAVAMWSDVVAKAPHNARAHFNLGIAQRRNGRDDEAEGAFRQTLDLDPHRHSALVQLGALLSESGRHSEAVEFLARAADDARVSPAVLAQYADALLIGGQPEAALPVLVRALAHDDADESGLVPGLQNNLGLTRAALGDPDGALGAFRAATEGVGAPAAAWANAARVEAARDRLDAAVDWAERGSRAYPEDSDLHLLRGRLHAGAGGTRAAVRAFVRVLELDPDRGEPFVAVVSLAAAHHADVLSELDRLAGQGDAPDSLRPLLGAVRRMSPERER